MTYAKYIFDKYYNNRWFRIGIILVLGGFFLYFLVLTNLSNAIPESVKAMWLSVSNIVLVVPIIGGVLCTFALYQVTRQTKPEKRGTKH